MIFNLIFFLNQVKIGSLILSIKLC